MEQEDKEKSLSRWRFELKHNKKNWGAFFQYFIGRAPSSYPRLFKLLTLYGDEALFEAIVESGSRSLDFNQDPLNYVAKVTKEYWKSQQRLEDESNQYINSIENAKQRTKDRNSQLSKKLKSRGTQDVSKLSRKSG